jgi:hypothetical protein
MTRSTNDSSTALERLLRLKAVLLGGVCWFYGGALGANEGGDEIV